MTHCLSISNLPKEDQTHIRDLAKQYREDDGLSHKEASEQSTQSLLSEYTQELTDITDAIESVGGVVPEGWVIAPVEEVKAEEVKEPAEKIEEVKPEVKAEEKPVKEEIIAEEPKAAPVKPKEAQKKAKPKLSKVKEPPKPLSTVEELTDTLSKGRFAKPVKKLMDQGKLEIVQSTDQLPAGVSQTGTAAAYLETEDKVYLVADLVSPVDVESVLLHESYHGRAEAVLGEKQYARLISSLKLMDRAKGKTADWFTKARAAIPTETPAEDVHTEIAAYAIEQHRSDPQSLPASVKAWANRFIAAIRRGLVRLGWLPKDFTAEDLHIIAQNSLKRFATVPRETTATTDAVLASKRGGKYIVGLDKKGFRLGALPRDMKEELYNEHAMNLNPEAVEAEFYRRKVPFGVINIEGIQIDKIPQSQLEHMSEVPFSKLPPIVVSDGRLIDGQHRIQLARNNDIKKLDYIDVTGIIDTDIGGYISELPESAIQSMKQETGVLYSKRDLSGTSKEKEAQQKAETITRMPKTKKALDNLADGFIYNFVNRFKDLSDIQKELGDIPESQDAALAEELFSGRARKRLDDLDDFHVRPLLEAIDKASMSLEDVGRYLHARHAVEANKVLKRRNPDWKENEALSGMSDAEAKTILAEFAKKPQIKGIARKVYAINDARLEKLVADGLVKQEEIDKWTALYKNYVPLHREQINSEESMLGDLPPTGSGFHIAGKETKLRAGSTKEVDHRFIVPHIVANYEASAIRGEKNLVNQTLLELVKNNPDPDIWKIDEYDTYVALDKDGVVVYKPDTRLHDHELGVKVNGDLHRISFNKDNPVAMRLVREMKNLQNREMPKFMQHVHTVMRFLSAINTSFNPEFAVTNPVRDFQTAGYNLADTDLKDVKLQILKDVPKGIKGMWKNLRHKHDSEWAKYADEFERAGGMIGWLDNYESIEDRARAVESEMKLIGKGYAARKTIRGMVDLVHDVNGALENGVRLSSYVHARRAGISAKKAASLAKNLTVNFNRKGASSQYFNLAYIFFNSSVQGSARMLSAIHKSKRVRGMVGATVAMAVAIDILNRSISGDDEDDRKYYDKIPDTVKDRNLIIMTGEGPADFIKIPLPWGYNIFHVFGQMIGRGVDSDQIQGYTAAKESARLMSAITEAFNPMSAGSFLQTISPTLLDPAVKVAENREWHGGPLMPEKNPFGPPTPNSQRYFRSASDQSKWIARELNELTGGNVVRPGWWDWSPEWFDMIVGDALGGAGTFTMKLTDTAKKAYTGEEFERKNIPFIRKIIGSEYPSADYELYFERVTDLETLKKELKEYRGVENKAIRSRHPRKIRMIAALKATQKRLKILRKRKRLLEAKKAPKERIDAVSDRILSEIKRFNKRYNDQVSR
jgi:hypothetical protein